MFLFVKVIKRFYFESLGSNCQMKFKMEDKHEVITRIDEPTLFLDMDKLLAKHTTNEFQGI